MKGVYSHLKLEDNVIISLIENRGRLFHSIKAFGKDLSKKASITILVLLVSFVSMAQKIEKVEQVQNGKESSLNGPEAYTMTASASVVTQCVGNSVSATVPIAEPVKLFSGLQWPYETTIDQPACGNDNINILQLAAMGGTGPYTYQVVLTNPSWLFNGPNTGTMVDGINEFNFYVGDGASTIQFTIKDKNGYTTTSSVDLKACQKL